MPTTQVILQLVALLALAWALGEAVAIAFPNPLPLEGVKYRPVPAAELLRRNVMIYDVGGLIVPCIGIELIDLFLAATHLA